MKAYEVGQKYWMSDVEADSLRGRGYVLDWTGEAECDDGVRMKRYEVTGLTPRPIRASGR